MMVGDRRTERERLSRRAGVRHQPKYLERFAAEARSGWEQRNFKLVIKTGIVNASHLW